jgi:hypothetical protein
VAKAGDVALLIAGDQPGGDVDVYEVEGTLGVTQGGCLGLDEIPDVRGRDGGPRGPRGRPSPVLMAG